MKGPRSNRVPTTTEPSDDWVNGSWTVDCICGVTFDDGEEMVNCDECGVWVHTRCSRFVKGEKSFACDKCKSKRSSRRRLISSSNTNVTVTDAEETEVAQLLVDLPTKTIHHHKQHLKMTHTNSTPTTTASQCFRPYPLWTQRPLEERVHVQGVPGGEPSLFDSNSNAKAFPLLISSNVWKSSGYIPKHFNFRYSEFPCWETPLDNIAVDPPPSLPDAATANHKQNQNTLLHFSNKRFREGSKDRPAKKKIKAFHRDHTQPETKQHPKLPSPKTAVISPTTATLLPVESKEHKSKSNPQFLSAINVEKPKRNAATDDAKFAPRSPEDSAPTTSIDKSALDHTSQLHISDTITLKSSPSSAKDVNFGTLVDKEMPYQGLALSGNEIKTANSESPTLASDMPKSKPLFEDLTNAALKHKNIEKAIIPMGSSHCSNETKSDAQFDNPKGILASHPTVNIKSGSFKIMSDYVSSPSQECKGSKLSEGVANTCKPLEQDEKDSDNGLEAVVGFQFDRNAVNIDVQCSVKLENEGSDGPTIVQKFLCDPEEVASVAGQTPQLTEAALTPSSHHKMTSIGKSPSTAPAVVLSRAGLSDKNRSGGSQNPSMVGKRLMSNSCGNTKKEPPVNLVKNEDKHDKPITTSKDNSKPCFSSTLNASEPSRSVLKCYTSVGKDSLRHSSSKVSSIDSSSVSSSVNEPAGALQSEHASHGENKNVASGCQQRGEKVSQSNLQQSSKSNHSSIGHPPASSNPPAGLSDEELAFLLHQELNSSPRVPRVPRVRHAGNVPQLSSATAANMLMKRSTNSGGKDRNTFSRRKSRDALKEESRNSRERDTEASKVDRVPPSPDSLRKSESFTQAEYNAGSKAKRNRDRNLSSAANSGSFSTDAAVLKSSPARVNCPEDDMGANKNSDMSYRTLPGLIAEIMGTGRRMTYEELCNAVLPHWPNLRKHNGERYAYSSHSQAVLDCLRNRTEWARLVDRGPKTSSSRKKRKIDAEPLSCESEDDEDRNHKDGESKSFESNKEEFPKGRRKARKRRGVGQQRRGGKEGQKRRKVEIGSSCESGSFSNSSDDTVSCEDESQGSEANSEVSGSSHEDRAMS